MWHFGLEQQLILALAENPASVVKVEMLFVVILCTGFFFLFVCFSFLFFSLCKSSWVVRRGRGGIHAERESSTYALKHFYFHDKKPLL